MDAAEPRRARRGRESTAQTRTEGIRREKGCQQPCPASMTASAEAGWSGEEYDGLLGERKRGGGKVQGLLTERQGKSKGNERPRRRMNWVVRLAWVEEGREAEEKRWWSKDGRVRRLGADGARGDGRGEEGGRTTKGKGADERPREGQARRTRAESPASVWLGVDSLLGRHLVIASIRPCLPPSLLRSPLPSLAPNFALLRVRSWSAGSIGLPSLGVHFERSRMVNPSTSSAQGPPPVRHRPPQARKRAHCPQSSFVEVAKNHIRETSRN